MITNNTQDTKKAFGNLVERNLPDAIKGTQNINYGTVNSVNSASGTIDVVIKITGEIVPGIKFQPGIEPSVGADVLVITPELSDKNRRFAIVFGATETDSSDPVASVTKSGTQTFSGAGTIAAITFNTETINTHGMHSTQANTDRITPNKTGVYLVALYGRWQSNATGWRFLDIQRSGADFVQVAGPPANGTETRQIAFTLDAVTTKDLAAGTYWNVRGAHNSGSDLTIHATTRFMAIRLLAL